MRRPRLLPILLALPLAGCATLSLWLYRPPRLADCPGILTSTRALPPGDFLLRERARVTGGQVDVGFELVAERRADRLVVVGLDAFGAKAFAVTQQGLDVEPRSFRGRALQVPPENVLRDLWAAHRLAPNAPPRAEVARPGCGYRTTFVTVERRALP